MDGLHHTVTGMTEAGNDVKFSIPCHGPLSWANTETHSAYKMCEKYHANGEKFGELVTHSVNSIITVP